MADAATPTAPKPKWYKLPTDDGMTYKLCVPLPNDGTPGAVHDLEVSVFVPTNPDENLRVALRTIGNETVRHIGEIETRHAGNVADLLYGAARLITRHSIEPV